MTKNEPFIQKNNNNNENVILKDNIVNENESESESESESQSQSQNGQNGQNGKNGKNENATTSTFWLNDPFILFDKNVITELWPIESMTREQKINSITRLVILLTLIGFLFLNDTKILITGITALIILVFTYYILNKNTNSNKIKESFSNEEIYDKVKHNFSNPTSTNPIMNVLLPEINENPNRGEAAPSFMPIVEEDINEKTKQFVKNNFL